MVDIGILTIREDEFQAVLSVFPDGRQLVRRRRHYNLRDAHAGSGQLYRVAILRQIEQGNGEAQDAARDLLAEMSPRLLLVVGIAGGLPSDDYTLGDVIVSTRINDYSVEARKEGEEPSYSISGGPIAIEVASGVANLPAMNEELGAWASGLPERPPIDVEGAKIVGPPAWQDEVREKLRRHFGQGAPRQTVVKAGIIASSDRLVKDPNVLFPWLQTARHIAAVEMESGGVYRAVRERVPMVAIRGISDIVGLKRDDLWTKYACATAAAFTFAYLRTTPIAPAKSNAGPLNVGRAANQSSLAGVNPRLVDALELSSAAQRIVDELPSSWGVKLFLQVLEDEIAAARGLKRELTLGVFFGPFEHLDDIQASQWIGRHWRSIQVGSSNLAHLVGTSVNRAMNSSDSSKDVGAVVYVARSVAMGYREIINWTLAWRRVHVSEALERVVSVGPRFGVSLVEQIEGWVDTIRAKLQEAEPEQQREIEPDESEVRTRVIELRLDLPEGLLEEFMRELADVPKAIELRLKKEIESML
jgi:nucleoside phosphorylase